MLIDMKPTTALRALLAALLCAAGPAARAQIEIDTVAADSMVVVDDVAAQAPAEEVIYSTDSPAEETPAEDQPEA